MKVALSKNISFEPDHTDEIEKLFDEYDCNLDQIGADPKYVEFAEQHPRYFDVVNLPDEATAWKIYIEENERETLIYVLDGEIYVVN